MSQCQQQGSLKSQIFIKIKSKTMAECGILCKHLQKIRGNLVKGHASGVLGKVDCCHINSSFQI